MSGPRKSLEWATEVFGEAKLGHQSRTTRLVKAATVLTGKTGASPSRAVGDDAAAREGIYRLIRNEKVAPEAIGAAGVEATSKKAACLERLLCIEDTSTLSYSHESASDLGDLGGPADSSARGFFVHSALLVDAQTSETVGLISQHYWMRDVEQRGKRHDRKQRDYQDKESFKWQQSSERVRARLGEATMARTTSVGDREGDVYPYLAYKLEHGDHFVVRASLDRRLVPDEDQPTLKHLWSVLEHAPVRAKAIVDVPQRGPGAGKPGRTARQAELTIRTARVRLRRPTTAPAWCVPRLTVNVVMAREEQPPVGAEPLEWVLLTTEPIDTVAQLDEVLRCYRLRWRIEEFHKAWKSGAGVERRRLQSGNNILRLAVILAFVAVRLLQLRERLHTQPDGACDEVLAKEEWQVLWVAIEKRRPPRRAPTIKWAYQALGRLAGWADSKRTGRVGWDTMWEGWYELQLRVEGYRAAQFLVGGRRN